MSSSPVLFSWTLLFFVEWCHTNAGEIMRTMLHVRKWWWHQRSTGTPPVAHTECPRKLCSSKPFVSSSASTTCLSRLVSRWKNSSLNWALVIRLFEQILPVDYWSLVKITKNISRTLPSSKILPSGYKRKLTSTLRIDCGHRRSSRLKRITWKTFSKILFIEKYQYVNQPHKPCRNSWKHPIRRWFHSSSRTSSTSTTRITRYDTLHS